MSPARARLLRLLPFLRWPRPSAQTLRRDAWAGLAVALVLIPQSLAYATLAGMPPVTGLYAALLPAVVGVLWGASPLLAVGPVALTSILSFAILQPLAVPGGTEWVALSIWLALYSGAIQFLLGALRLGLIANFVSNPLIAGFINAAALSIILSQLPALFGVAGGVDADWPRRLATTWHADPGLLATTAGFGFGALALLLLLRRFAPRLPGVLLVCVGGTAISAALGFAGSGGAVVGSVPAGLPQLALPPSLGLEQHRALLPGALIVALVSFTEAMSSCRALSQRSARRWDENQELVGQGLAKIVSGASGAFPVSGSFSRSALNVFAGAVSGWSTLFAVAGVVVFLLFLTDALHDLPRALLAAVIVAPVLGLIDFGVFARLWRISRDDGLVALVSFAATLASMPQLHWGVLAGFVTAMLCFLYRRAHPRIVELGLHADGTLRDRFVHGLPPLAPDVLAVRIDASLSYVTAPLLERFVLERVGTAAGVRTVLLCVSAANDLDATGVDMLRRMHRELARADVVLRLSAVKRQFRAVLDRAGLSAELGEAALLATDREAIMTLVPQATSSP
ncbi:SulP family inorganic anion transporter [Aromatoleum evansii]|uniref:SulP family inorganic anion transporter n=1 Tax=Aromatoleum evansii TaxID=59406 RepID=A0ABZ1ASP7_AROEV|nr:SulP family inorganic anion transporter [Aromatoleum evansii]